MITIIYAPNVNSGGGLNLILALTKAPLKMCFLDIRIRKELEPLINSKQVFWIKKGIFFRIFSEIILKKIVTSEDKVLILHNVPPLFKLRGRAILFFQNTLILDKDVWPKFNFYARLKFIVSNIFLRIFCKNIDEVDVQSFYSKRLISNHFKHCQINIRPLVYQIQRKENQVESYYLCVANHLPHKNIQLLFFAWQILVGWGLNASLQVTVSREEMESFIAFDKQSSELKNIHYLGEISHENCLEKINNSKALIVTSFTESFCLPLYEAKVMSKDIIAPELDYVRDFIDPTETFSPHSPLSLARAIARHNNFSYPQVETLGLDDFLDKH